MKESEMCSNSALSEYGVRKAGKLIPIYRLIQESIHEKTTLLEVKRHFKQKAFIS